jgi:hypothetical protein
MFGPRAEVLKRLMQPAGGSPRPQEITAPAQRVEGRSAAQ